MDKEMKLKGLASATARKRNIQEREKQKQKQIMREQREERQKRMIRYSELYSTDSGSDQSRSNSPENENDPTDTPSESPSECSVTTPAQSLSPNVEIRIHTDLPQLDMFTQQEIDTDTATKHTYFETQRSKSKTSKPTTFAASLTTISDFRYDRFSTFIEPIKQQDESTDSSSGSEAEDDEDAEDYSPIEVATPVAIRMPMSRPSMISVISTGSSEHGPQRFSVRNISAIMIDPPEPKPMASLAEQEIPTQPAPLLLPETRPHNGSGFLAAEAKPLEVITPSSASIVSMEPSSTQSLRSLPSSEQSMPEHNLKKKSSIPMLQKFKHARMNSIKNFMKPQSISGPPPAVPALPSAHQSRPSDSVNHILSAASHQPQLSITSNKTLPTSPRRSLTEPHLSRVLPQDPRPQTARMQEVRPQTARLPSQNSITSISARPPPPSIARSALQSTLQPQPQPQPQTVEDDRSINPKKSFQNLRRRSGSLGQALKFGSSKTKSPTPEAPLPPMPTINVPSRESLIIETSSYPTPPPKTPRGNRKSGMGLYSPFPQPVQRGEPVGLGLRI